MPSLFDQLTGENGLNTRSFNFGVAGMHTPEDSYVLDLILSRPHKNLRWVLLEIDFFDVAVQKDEAETARGVYWHDWRRMCTLADRLLVARDGSLAHRFRAIRGNLPDFIDHAKLCFQKNVNPGRGSDLLHRWLFNVPAEDMDWNELGESGDGWLPALPREVDSQELRSGALRQALNDQIAHPPERRTADRGSQMALSAMLRRIVKAGATPVLIIPPHGRQYYFYPEPALAEQYPIIDLCIPHLYPDLYRDDLRVNRSHFNPKGAEVFTRIVTDQFLKSAVAGR